MKNNGIIYCQHKDCKKLAKYNIQSIWHRYEIKYRKGRTRLLAIYTNEKMWEADEDENYCEEHAKEEGII